MSGSGWAAKAPFHQHIDFGMRGYMKFKTVTGAIVGLFFAASAFAQTPPATPAEPVMPEVKAAPLEVPPLEPENTLHLDLSTGGRVSIQLRPDVAPAHVERIKALTRQGFYSGVIFHRVIEGFMAQTGDPTGTGQGGSQLPDLAAEFTTLPHVRGAVSAARAGDPNSANSQFFVMLSPRLSLDGKYSVFGRVVDGMEFVDKIERGEPPANPTRIVRASIGSDNVPPLPASALTAPVAPPPATPPSGSLDAAEEPVQATPPQQ
jgi:cyclophilin family peptidyl-prolyl cis-trans isomerase